ncbi:EndoU domain-containing protein, partial [Prosthecobacter sp.]|uniref:EndoU domain-containing protein n=1 Tax=Prosthecobacter sp. TaxID=1965333 RepID=UPI00378402BE
GTTTSTASSGGTTTPSIGRGSGTHTTNGVTAPPVGHGNLIPEDTTHPEHIDLANRRTENLEEVARKRPLNPHEQEVYDNARRVRDRNSPATPGSRNTGNPDDLAMSGDEDALVPVTPDGEDATLDAAADSPPASPPAQPANAVGTTISRPGAANPDTPMASAGSSTPPPNAPPPNAPPPNAPPPNAPPPNVPPPNVPPPNVPPPNVPPPNAAAYPPIDHDHIIKADFNKDGAPTGGHSLVNNDVRIIPGTASRTNPQGVYEARVEMQNASGGWQAKLSNNGWNTMFPQNWSEHQIKTEVEAAWNSSMKTISPNGKKWRSVTPSGVVVEGYINPHTPNKPGRITAYPIY